MKKDRTEFLETKKDFLFKNVAPNEIPLLANLVTYNIDGEEVFPFIFDYESDKTGDLIASYMVEKTKNRYTVSRVGLRKRNEVIRHVEEEKAEIKKSLRKGLTDSEVPKKSRGRQKEKKSKK